MERRNAKTNYDEIQENEISALRAIFMDNFEGRQSKGVWNKKPDREFVLTLRPLSASASEDISVVLEVTLPTTYPKTEPNCRVIYNGRISSASREAIARIVKEKPKELPGSEVIYEIASTIQEVLEDAVANIAETEDRPTLEEERATQEAETQRKAESDRLQQEMQRKIDDEEGERLLAEMVEKERSRVARLQERHHRMSNDMALDNAPSGDLTFDQDIRIRLPSKSTVIVFRSIIKKGLYRKGPVTSVLRIDPIQAGTEDTQEHNESTIVVLKACTVRSEKKFIQNLESKLQMLVELSTHPSVLRTLAFRIIKEPVGQLDWNVNILVPFAKGHSFRDLLQTIRKIDITDMRPWLIQILEGLQFLHQHQVVLGRLNVDNILLDMNESGVTVAKISDAGFQYDLHLLQHGGSTRFSSAAASDWLAPESGGKGGIKPQPPLDIWDFGVFLLQSLFGLDVQRQYHSPTTLIEDLNLSSSLSNLLTSLFRADAKKRPGAFEVLPNEFLRNNDPLVLTEQPPEVLNLTLQSSLTSVKTPRGRRDSSFAATSTSRYANDFVELGRLGRGGFGEVVRARNKLDGSTYAIKKILQSSAGAIDGVLSEVMLLSRLNHPFIVRYYAVWVEENSISRRSVSSESLESEASFSELPSSNNRGLDFISSGGYPKIEFGYASDDDAGSEAVLESEAEDSESGNRTKAKKQILQRRRSSTVTVSHVTLYIQMEYCEKQTLRDIFDELQSDPDECWRLFRQILDCLAYIHSNGILHRDLKPDNIFITMDETNMTRIKVGDFGLARPGESSSRPKQHGFIDPQLTASIGTSLYVAPEVRSSGGGTYNDKADMYSLGIILFEMSYKLSTAMERVQTLENLRLPSFVFPSIFQEPEKHLQVEIVKSLIKQKPSERPSSQDLLRSGKIPSHVEDETIRNALQSLSDKSSPLFAKLLEQLFLHIGRDMSPKDLSYDLDINLVSQSPDMLMLESMLRARLVSIFIRHGALETQRQQLIPASQHYDAAVRLLDSSGRLLQLPYDLTLPYARSVAKQTVVIGKSFSFGQVFRVAPAGMHPYAHGEVDFDIVTSDSLDLALREAETIKIIDEVMDAIPSMSALSIVYYITHSRLLDAILVTCGITASKSVKQVLSKLNIGQWTWTRIRNELRGPNLSVASTSLDDLMRFDFREPFDIAVPRLRALLSDNIEDVESTFRHLEAVTTYLERFRVKRKVLISPLSGVNEQFYRGGILFQCIQDSKRKKVICAGGRYDSLIQEHRTGPKLNRHGVGFNLAWNTLLESMAQLLNPSGKQYLKKTDDDIYRAAWKPRRCDILVDSHDAAVLRSAGIDIVQELWANSISAELVIDSTIRESTSYQSLARDENCGYGWIVLIKQDESLKIRSVARKEDIELRRSELVSWLRLDMRERDRSDARAAAASISISSMAGGKALPPHLEHAPSSGIGGGGSSGLLSGGGSGAGGSGAGAEARHVDVQIVVAQHRSKKTNRRNIMDDALSRTAAMSSSFLAAPIAAVELKDELFDALRETRLVDPESWRRCIQAAPLAERLYLSQVHELLADYAARLSSARAIWLYNFRSRSCFLYDLGKEAPAK